MYFQFYEMKFLNLYKSDVCLLDLEQRVEHGVQRDASAGTGGVPGALQDGRVLCTGHPYTHYSKVHEGQLVLLNWNCVDLKEVDPVCTH